MWRVDKSKITELEKSLTLSDNGETLYCFSDQGIPFALGKKFFKKTIFRETVSFKFIGQPKEEQTLALNRAKSLWLEEKSLILNYPTGFGKTFCAIYLASLTNKVVCVVYPLITLERQWQKSFTDLTTARVWDKSKNYDVDVILTTPGKIHKLPRELKDKIGCLIVDEVHLFCTNLKYKNLLSIEPEYCMGLTATMEKSPFQVKALECMFGKIVVEKQRKKASIFRHYTNISFPSVKNRKGKEDWAALCRNMAANKERNERIAKDIMEHSGKILVLTLRINQAKELYSILTKQGEDVSLFIQNNKTYQEKRVLISTAKKAGTGFDDANSAIDFSGERFSLLVLTFSVKEVLFLKQLLGRVFRTELPNVIEYVDEHFISYNHARKRDEYYESQNYDIYVIRPE